MKILTARTRLLLVSGFTLFVAASLNAQSFGSMGRFSLFGQSARQQNGSGTSDFRELSSTLTLRSGNSETLGFQYALDARFATYPGSGRGNRTSLYDAFVGFRTARGFGMRVGQMWLNELGGLGSLGGALAEWQQAGTTWAGRLRFGLFGGLEPQYFETGYAPNIRKGGGYVALDGSAGRRHVLGYVQVRNQNLVERSVVTMMNFVPAGTKFFLDQTAEFDLRGPAGNGSGGLNYLFANVRWAPVRAFEIQTTYHHGLSIDARTITNDILNGRPVDSRAFTGLLYESAGARFTVTPFQALRVWAGYARDRNNRGEDPSLRSSMGISSTDLFHLGFDFAVTGARIDRGTNGSYNSWNVSLGRSIGPKVYLTADYSTALSVIRFLQSNNVFVESRPHTRRASLSSLINLNRTLSFQLTGERLISDDSTEDRVLTGISVRF